jgi:hypothetical protein
MTTITMTPKKKDNLNYIIESLLAHLRTEITRIDKILERDKKPLNIIALKYTREVVYSHLFKIIQTKEVLIRHIFKRLFRNEVLHTALYHNCLKDLKSIECIYPEYFYLWYT